MVITVGMTGIYLQIYLSKKLNEHLLPGLEPLGVPKGLKGSVIPFKFNNWEDLDNVVRKRAKKEVLQYLSLVERVMQTKNLLLNLENSKQK